MMTDPVCSWVSTPLPNFLRIFVFPLSQSDATPLFLLSARPSPHPPLILLKREESFNFASMRHRQASEPPNPLPSYKWNSKTVPPLLLPPGGRSPPPRSAGD